jgi:hypothetical protein
MADKHYRTISPGVELCVQKKERRAAKVVRRHRVAQLEQRLLCGPGWTDSDLVFTNPCGVAWHPYTVSGVVQRLINQ